jgi:transposase
VERTCGLEAGAAAWSARVFGVRAPVHAERQAAGLETRLAHAAPKRAALTPASGRGQRQSTDDVTRLAAIAHVRNAQRVAGWLSLEWAPPLERPTHDVGRGRGSATRAQRVPEQLRAHMTRLARRDGPMADRIQRVGGKAFVTNATPERLSLADAVVGDRHAYRLERLFNRLKSRVSIAPLCVKRDDHMQGLTYLLTWGVRVFTGLECVLRRSRENAHAQLPGLHPENRHQMTDTPTAERLLNACSDVSRTIIKTAAGEDIVPRLTPLSAWPQDILQRLGLDTSLDQQLAIQVLIP